MPNLRPTWLLVAVVAMTWLLGGCSDDGTPTHDGSSARRATEAADEPRCFSGVPDGARVVEHALPIAGAEVSAIEFPAEGSRTVMVLLHQTGAQGACGWGRFAAAAQAVGVTSLAIDQCGYGNTTCSDTTGRSEVVAAATGFARDELGAGRVVLVGASMGGNDAVAAVHHGVEVDAWADISGPDVWGDVRLSSLEWPRRTGGDALVMYGADEPPDEIAAARRLARASGAEFVLRPRGHGYDLLTTWRGRLTDGGWQLLELVAPES